MTDRTFSIFVPVTLTFDDSVLGLVPHTRFFLFGTVWCQNDVAWRAIKVAVKMRAVIGWSSATDVFGTVKTATSTIAIPLTGMVFFIVGVETLFTLQTIILSVHEGRKEVQPSK